MQTASVRLKCLADASGFTDRGRCNGRDNRASTSDGTHVATDTVPNGRWN